MSLGSTELPATRTARACGVHFILALATVGEVDGV